MGVLPPRACPCSAVHQDHVRPVMDRTDGGGLVDKKSIVELPHCAVDRWERGRQPNRIGPSRSVHGPTRLGCCNPQATAPIMIAGLVSLGRSRWRRPGPINFWATGSWQLSRADDFFGEAGELSVGVHRLPGSWKGSWG